MRISKNINCEISKKNWEMMNLKRLALWLSLGGMVASLSSCMDDDDTKVESFGLGDVFIESQMDGENLVHRPVYFAYSDYYAILAAEVSSENMDTVELDKYMKYNTTFVNKDAEFSADLPAAEEYEFTIEFGNGDEKVVIDSLEEHFITPPVIEDIDDSVDGKLRIEWVQVDDDEKVDAYSVRLFDEDDELIYSSPLLSTDDDDFTINYDDNFWVDRDFLSGDVKVKVSAYRFEDGVEGNAGYYHYQAVGVTYQDATWTTAE